MNGTAIAAGLLQLEPPLPGTWVPPAAWSAPPQPPPGRCNSKPLAAPPALPPPAPPLHGSAAPAVESPFKAFSQAPVPLPDDLDLDLDLTPEDMDLALSLAGSLSGASLTTGEDCPWDTAISSFWNPTTAPGAGLTGVPGDSTDSDVLIEFGQPEESSRLPPWARGPPAAAEFPCQQLQYQQLQCQQQQQQGGTSMAPAQPTDLVGSTYLSHRGAIFRAAIDERHHQGGSCAPMAQAAYHYQQQQQQAQQQHQMASMQPFGPHLGQCQPSFSYQPVPAQSYSAFDWGQLVPPPLQRPQPAARRSTPRGASASSALNRHCGASAPGGNGNGIGGELPPFLPKATRWPPAPPQSYSGSGAAGAGAAPPMPSYSGGCGWPDEDEDTACATACLDLDVHSSPSAGTTRPPPRDGAGRSSLSKPPSGSSQPAVAVDISDKDLRNLFRLPIEKARAALRVSKNAFRTLLLQRGYKRWPQRQLMGLANLRHKTAEDATLTEPVRAARLARIRANVQAIYEGTQCSMSSELKKMSHVYHNRTHQVKQRTKTGEEDDQSEDGGDSDNETQ